MKKTGITHFKRSGACAFTLAELLIALAILGVIATFTIPKVLQAQQDQRFNAVTKEAMGSVSGAWQAANLKSPLTANSGIQDLTPFLNYVASDTAGVNSVDLPTTMTTVLCNTYNACLRLHGGATLVYWPASVFYGTAVTNALPFLVDPDGKVTDSTTNGPGKAVQGFLYFNGRIKTYATIDPNSTYYDGSTVWNDWPCSTCDPQWFHWN